MESRAGGDLIYASEDCQRMAILMVTMGSYDLFLKYPKNLYVVNVCVIQEHIDIAQYVFEMQRPVSQPQKEGWQCFR